MEFSSQSLHPNGFKISLALLLNNSPTCCSVVKSAVEDGAVLRVPDEVTGVKLGLTSNSAVLYLLSPQLAADADTADWLHWEAAVLQRCVHRVVSSRCAGRSDAAAIDALTATLQKLEGHLAKAQQPWLAGESMGSSDVCVVSSLLPLCAVPALSLPTATAKYITAAARVQHVQSCLQSWYGVDVPSRIPLTCCPPPPPPGVLGAHTWQLLRCGPTATAPTATAPTAATNSSPELVKEERRISAAEVSAAECGWRESLTGRTKSVASPVRPVKGERNILITSALPYVNNVPHLGNIIGCVLSADCFARFCRLREYNVIYVSGTDEYGTATETKAIAENMTPKQICDKYHEIHSNVYKDFNISFDHFGRTSTPNQTEIVHELFWDLEKNGNICRQSVEQLYCDACQRFLADRFVEGICPHPGCGFEDARGDQCDGCGKLVNSAELVKPRCKLCSATPRIKSSDHLFIDLPKIEPEMRKWFNVSSKRWSHNAGTICNSWLRDGLLPRCITRDLKWGVPVPLDGYKDKVFYVWFDAPIGYMSITKEYTKDWENWWKNPDEVELYQFMAKDNVPFHGIIFPCTLTGSPKPWTRVTNLEATEYLNYEDGKFSKSRGIGVFGDEAMNTDIPSDVWRFYLLYIRPENQDTAFAWTDLQMKNNTELLNNLGNFVNRALKFVAQFYDGIVPDATPNQADFTMMATVNFELNNYTTALGNVKLRDGIRHILAISRIGNQYIQDNEPYKLIKAGRSDEEKKRGATVITVAVNLVHLVALLLEPYMPDTSAKILGFLNLPTASKCCLPSTVGFTVRAGNKITEPVPLIKKISDEEIQSWQQQFQGEQQPAATKDKKQTPATSAVDMPADSAEVARIQQLVTEQGEKIRSLKSGGASKSDIAPEVAALLALKQQLAQAQGTPSVDASSNNKKKKGGKAAAAAAPTPAANGVALATVIGDQAEVDRIQALVTHQGNAVRSIKSSSASKEEINTEVAKLLALKAELATASGVDLNATGKSKKKKK